MTDKEYKLVESLVTEIGRRQRWSKDDMQDFLQDMLVKLLEANPEHITRRYAYMLAHWMLADRKRKDDRRPQIIFSSDLTEYILDKKDRG